MEENLDEYYYLKHNQHTNQQYYMLDNQVQDNMLDISLVNVRTFNVFLSQPSSAMNSARSNINIENQEG